MRKQFIILTIMLLSILGVSVSAQYQHSSSTISPMNLELVFNDTPEINKTIMITAETETTIE